MYTYGGSGQYFSSLIEESIPFLSILKHRLDQLWGHTLQSCSPARADFPTHISLSAARQRFYIKICLWQPVSQWEYSHLTVLTTAFSSRQTKSCSGSSGKVGTVQWGCTSCLPHWVTVKFPFYLLLLNARGAENTPHSLHQNIH